MEQPSNEAMMREASPVNLDQSMGCYHCGHSWPKFGLTWYYFYQHKGVAWTFHFCDTCHTAACGLNPWDCMHQGEPVEVSRVRHPTGTTRDGRSWSLQDAPRGSYCEDCRLSPTQAWHAGEEHLCKSCFEKRGGKRG